MTRPEQEGGSFKHRESTAISTARFLSRHREAGDVKGGAVPESPSWSERTDENLKGNLK